MSSSSASSNTVEPSSRTGSPTLLYIGHAFHTQTKSTDFLQEMLRSTYEVRRFLFDPFTDDPLTHFRPLYGSRFDVAVLFQVMPDLDRLRAHVNLGKCVFVPMFDYLPPLEDPIWETYRQALIICFSSTLYDALLERGYHARFIQYFPPVPPLMSKGNPRKVFFWQRVNAISLDTITTLFRNIPLDSIHHHKALDPGFYERPVLTNPPCPVTESRWFPRKADLIRTIESAAIYMAPRLYEGIGMSFLEAMAMGRCVVAPDNPTMSEYIEHGKTGILYDPTTPMPLEPFDVPAIQRAARMFAETGRHEWEEHQFDILKWIREWHPVPSKVRHSTLPIATLRKTQTTSVFWFLGFLPVLRVSAGAGIVVYWLFCFLPLLVKRKRETDVSFWLLGIVRLWRSEVRHE